MADKEADIILTSYVTLIRGDVILFIPFSWIFEIWIDAGLPQIK